VRGGIGCRWTLPKKCGSFYTGTRENRKEPTNGRKERHERGVSIIKKKKIIKDLTQELRRNRWKV